MQFVLIIGLGGLLALFVAYAQALLSHSTNTGLLGWLASVSAKIPFVGGLTVNQVLRLDAWITHQLGAHFKQLEHRGVGWLAGLSTYLKVVAAAGLNLAAVQWAFAVWVTRVAIPTHTKAAVAPVKRVADLANARAVKAVAAIYALQHGHRTTVKPSTITNIERVAMPHAEEWNWITHHWQALVRAVTAPVTLPGLIAKPAVARIDGWTKRNLRFHTRRLSRLEKLLGVAGFAAILARTLGVSIRCVRPGGNVSKVARSLCGIPTRLLDDLLGVLADVWLLENVCVLLPFLEQGASVIGTPLVEALTEVGAGICKGSKAPGALRGPSARLPAPLPAFALSLV